MPKIHETARCPNCHHTSMRIVYEQKEIPAHSVLLFSDQKEARQYPTGDMQLGFCEACSFFSNLAFNPELSAYGTTYESTQSYSPTFDRFSRRMAVDLVARYGIRGKQVVEIGCGMGEFLVQLCEAGQNRGLGFDPAYLPGRVRTEAEVEFVKDYFSEKYADITADLLVCKMTLEHIPNTANFVEMVRQTLSDAPDTIVYFQVPDMTRILREAAFWDIYYEHCSYFTAPALARVFERAGFEILCVVRVFGDQYLVIEARPGESFGVSEKYRDSSYVAQDLAFFEMQIECRIAAWNTYLSGKKRPVLWGAGSKGVAFLAAVNSADQVEFCVDINPHKQGAFMPGSGHAVISPSQLVAYQPDVVILMNSIYRDEVSRDLKTLGLDVELITVNDIV